MLNRNPTSLDGSWGLMVFAEEDGFDKNFP